MGHFHFDALGLDLLGEQATEVVAQAVHKQEQGAGGGNERTRGARVAIGIGGREGLGGVGELFEPRTVNAAQGGTDRLHVGGLAGERQRVEGGDINLPALAGVAEGEAGPVLASGKLRLRLHQHAQVGDGLGQGGATEFSPHPVGAWFFLVRELEQARAGLIERKLGNAFEGLAKIVFALVVDGRVALRFSGEEVGRGNLGEEVIDACVGGG